MFKMLGLTKADYKADLHLKVRASCHPRLHTAAAQVLNTALTWSSKSHSRPTLQADIVEGYAVFLEDGF